jgi:hypothetical protein
LKRLT